MGKAATARQRIEGPALKSWEEVDHSLRQIGLIDLDLEAKEAEYNRQVAEIKLGLEMDAKPLQDRKALLELQIKEYTEANKAGLGDGETKSREMNFGRLGFRQSTKLVVRNVKAVIGVLRAKKMFDCILVKEDVSKEALRKYDDKVLSEVGVVRKVDDTFWYEVNRDELRRV